MLNSIIRFSMLATIGYRTYIEWTAEFSCSQQEEDLVKSIGDGVFQGGFDSLKSIFSG